MAPVLLSQSTGNRLQKGRNMLYFMRGKIHTLSAFFKIQAALFHIMEANHVYTETRTSETAV